MRRSWLLIGIALLAAVFAIGAVACGDDDDNGSDALEDAIDDALDDLPDDIVLLLVASLTEEGGSGASGEASLTPNGETAMLVNIDMTGLSEGTHPQHIHVGSCADKGDIVIPLTNIVADETGVGSQIDPPDGTLEDIAEGHHYDVHESDSDLTVVACGDIVSGI